MQRYATKRRDGMDIPMSVVLFSIEGYKTQVIKTSAPTSVQEAFVRRLKERHQDSILFGVYEVVDLRDWSTYVPPHLR